MIVKVRSHTVYKLKDGRYKCEVWYIDETGETIQYEIIITDYEYFSSDEAKKSYAFIGIILLILFR